MEEAIVILLHNALQQLNLDDFIPDKQPARAHNREERGETAASLPRPVRSHDLMRRQPPQQQPQQPVAVEEGSLPHTVGLQASTPLDGSLPGVALKAASLLAWHPTRQRLLTVATTAAVEYDAVSGTRRNLVEVWGTPLRVTYTSNGSAVVLLTKERGIYAWSTSTWKRRVLLPPDPKHAGKQLAAGLLAVSSGRHPIVYWTPLGKNSVRMVNSMPVDVPKGGKLDRELVPGVKLKMENKKAIVGLAVHPTERGTLFVLLADGTLQVCLVSGAAAATVSAFPVTGINPAVERVAVHAWPHPILAGGAMLAVEAAIGGVCILEAAPRQEPRLLGMLTFGAGSTICGVGLLASGLLCAAGRHASGNVQVQAWELAGDSRELQVLPTVAVPGMVWDALQSMAGKAALADVSGKNVVTRLHFHPPTGAIAVATALRGREGEAAHQRVPLLHLVDGADGAGAPQCSPMHTGLGFWTSRDSGDSTVSKLRFPRYAHVISGGHVCNYDLTHGMLSDCLVLPPANAAGQERRFVRAVRSPRQSAWLAFAKVLSRQREGCPLGPGQCEFSLVSDSEAVLASGQWMLPGADGAFVGARDDMVVVLSNSGRTLSLYETAKLSGSGAGTRPLYSAELKEGGLVAAVFPGPPAHIPSPPTRSPVLPPTEGDLADSDDSDAGEDDATIAARQEWEAAERRRLDLPRLLLLHTQGNQLVLAEAAPTAVTYANKSRVLPVRASLALRHGEVLVQVAWQSLMPTDSSFHASSEGAATAAAAAAAVLTSQRLLLVNERLGVVVSAGIPPDMGLPVSCLWMGPALLVSTSTGQVVQVCWDGKLVHLCSVLQGAVPALLGALADRLLIATKTTAAGQAEVGGRGISILQPLLLGWASLAQRHLLPGGAVRVRRELRTLVASYDASQLGVATLERLAAAGFADVAAAVAARSDSPAITPAHKAVFQAAAGDWQPLLILVLQEWEASAFHPGPPPRNSQLYARMVALARTCQQYGRFRDARQLLAGAGAHAEFMAQCVFQGDFQGLQAHARKGGHNVELLADQLMAVNENAFVHGSTSGSLYGGRANTDDWSVAAADSEPEAGPSGRAAPAAGHGGEMEMEKKGMEALPSSGLLEIDVAPAGRLPFQEASLQVLSAADPVQLAAPHGDGDEGQPIEGLDLGTLEAYVGLAGAHVIKPGLSTPTAASAGTATAVMGGGGAGARLGRMDTGMSELSNPLEPDLAAAIDASRAALRSGYGSEGEAVVGKDETAAQAAARAAFRRDTADDEDDFFSSDEESAPTEADTRSVGSMTTNSVAASSSQRFRVSIKPAEEAATPGRDDTGALRAAAQNLRLGAVSSLGGSTDSTPFATSRSVANLGGAKSGTLPPPPSATPVKASTSAGSALDQAAATAATASVASLAASSVSSDDPFADLFGLGAPAGQQPSAKPLPPPPASAASGPMRPQAAPVAKTSNLLSGWDDFEALFAAVPIPAAQQQPGSSPIGLVSFLPPPPPVPRSRSPPKPPAGAAAAVVPMAAGGGMKRSGSVAELAPAGVKKAVDEGLAAFQEGLWDSAASQFGKAVDKGGGADPSFDQEALQLFVAARLLAAAAVAANQAQHATAARLARFALPLPLPDEQRLTAVAYAVDANMAARNYDFAANQLTWLIIQSTSGAKGLDAMALQDKLNACDRAGGANGTLPREEDRDSFAAIVASCRQRGEAEELVSNIISVG